MEYNSGAIERKWQKRWADNKTYQVAVDKNKSKFYVLDMFPYPSGAGLHVGHPLGYIASDIYARYKRLNGFNVLHPMGYDAYGLPAEQYAIQTGQHPAITTEKNIKRYREQLDKIGFCYDWSREVKTCEPSYYKWTQWTFIQLFNSWYNNKKNKAENIKTLIAEFEKSGNANIHAAYGEIENFTAKQWKAMNEKQQQEVLMNYRLAYLSDTMVNWCPELGTVLANDEVKEGISVRGGHPVERKLMRQWLLRITAYAERLLNDLETLEWSDSLKEIQRNWIGRSEGCSVKFKLSNSDKEIEVFTTRPDTLFGATFMVLAPEHEFVEDITPPEYKEKVSEYVQFAKNRSERERMSEVKKITGEFTGAYAVNPFNKRKMPIWIADYVLAGYGTGAVMAVPGHDGRDYVFAKHFNIPILEVVSGGDITKEAFESKEGTMINSDFINGMKVPEAIETMINKVVEMNLGEKQVNYRLRDAIFSRQRYWGEPFPVYYKDDMPYVMDESMLPLELPEVDAFLPTQTGQPPLARAKDWKTKEGYPLECNTMPGFAGSSGYYLRFMDPHNDKEYFSKEANNYWQDVDLYIGGAEHATGHLVYARFWNKFLFDIGLACKDEPFKKLINQGMIQGRSNFVYRVKNKNTFISKNKIHSILTEDELKKAGINYSPPDGKKADCEIIKNVLENNRNAFLNSFNVEHTPISGIDYIPIHVDVNIVNNDILDIEAFKNSRQEYKDAQFILEEDGKYHCGHEIEKMSKSKLNVVNPDDLIERYGADTFRMYEMFLGPLDQSKPWDTNGIEGVFRFIRKLWNLYHSNNGNFTVSDEQPSNEELKVLHKTIKKILSDIERFSFNTAVSTFMICVNELTDLKCNKRIILNNLAILISPFAPHISEELWELLGNKGSINDAAFPEYKEEYITESTFSYPVSFNGKVRFKIDFPVDMDSKEIEKVVLSDEKTQKWLENKSPKKIIIVPQKIINIVV